MTVEWMDPPEAPSKAEQTAAELRTRPGQWARVERRVPMLANGLSGAWWVQLRKLPGIEVRYVQPAGAVSHFGPRDVFARYTGNGDPDADDYTADDAAQRAAREAIDPMLASREQAARRAEQRLEQLQARQREELRR